jgi:hypothetical protein
MNPVLWRRELVRRAAERAHRCVPIDQRTLLGAGLAPVALICATAALFAALRWATL